MKKNNITVATMATINRTGNTLLRALRAIKNYDYRNDLTIYEINGPFTVNQVKKEVAAAGYNTYNATITILLKGDYFKNEYNLATLTAGDTVNTDFNYIWFDNRKGAEIRRYIAKGDFNQDRKKENAHAFVICQLNENMTKPDQKEINLKGRFNVIRVNRWCKQYGNTSYIGDIETTLHDAAGQKYTRKGTFTREEKLLENVIDKSGYFVDIKRHELKHRARLLRAEREKAAYTAINNAAKLEELKKEIETLKDKVVNQVTKAATGDEMQKCYEYFKLWGGLPDIMKAHERIVKKDQNKEYPTIADFENAYKNLKDAIQELNKKMEV